MSHFKADHKYMCIYWQSNWWWAHNLRQSSVFDAKSFEQVLEEKLSSATVTAASVQAKAAATARVTSAVTQAAIRKETENEYDEKKRLVLQESAVRVLTLDEKRLARKHFNEIDTDGSNSIELSELRSYLSQKGVPSGSQATLMFKEGDTDKNGSIDFNEFCTMISKASHLDASKHWGDLWQEIEAELSGSSPRGNKRGAAAVETQAAVKTQAKSAKKAKSGKTAVKTKAKKGKK